MAGRRSTLRDDDASSSVSSLSFEESEPYSLDEDEDEQGEEGSVDATALTEALLPSMRSSTRYSQSPYGSLPLRRQLARLITPGSVRRVSTAVPNPIQSLKRRTLAEQGERKKNWSRRRSAAGDIVVRSLYPVTAVTRERFDRVLQRSKDRREQVVLRVLFQKGHILSNPQTRDFQLVNAYTFRVQAAMRLSLDLAILVFLMNLFNDLTILRSGLLRRRLTVEDLTHLFRDIWPRRYARPSSLMPT